jgi:hypothetical protein
MPIGSKTQTERGLPRIFWVVCDDCEAAGPVCQTVEEAIHQAESVGFSVERFSVPELHDVICHSCQEVLE